MFITRKKYIVAELSLFLLFIIPILSSAAIVNCDGSKANPCNFEAFVDLINGIIDWVIGIAGVIFTISFIWGGFLYLTSGENPGNRDRAKGILWNTLIGFVIILTAWLIVFTILRTLTPYDSDNTIFKFIGGTS